MATVSLRNLVKRYGALEIVHGINLEVADREFIALVGPSGCGKSTTLRMIAGLEDISGGEVLIGGKVVNDLPPRSRNLAMVFQSYALYPHMTVRENMGFSLKIAGQPQQEIDARVNDAAKTLDLESLMERRPSAFKSRRQAAHPDANRDQEAARQGPLDRRLCHPRPGRGDDAGRPHRHHA
jgi:multiple sugar transport system ATP-binding protein